MFVIGLVELGKGWERVAVITLLYVASVAFGWVMRSAALAKSGLILVVLIPLWLLFFGEKSHGVAMPTACVAALMIAACFTGLPLWRRRTGDRHPRVRSLGQAFVVCVAGLVMLRAFYNYDANITLAAGIWTLVCALYAAAGLFTGVVYVVVLYASLVALIILIEVLSLPHLSQRDEALFAKDAIWGLVATLMIVASERALVHARRLKLPWRCSPQDWLSKRSINRVTVFAGVGTLIMAVLSLRLLPDLRRFYFTGAMVVAAFVWIVFGFLFNEPVYRKSGFVLLCFGIVKGLIWDVLSIKNTVYRQVSWTVLGLLALAASFLYNKFRTRLGGEDAEE